MITNIIILVVLLFLSAFFSGTEAAFLSLSDAKIEAMVKKKAPRAKLLQKFAKNSRRTLVTILIGNNIVNIASASLATVVATEIFDSAGVGIATGVMTILILIFGEIIPKSYADNYNERVAGLAAPMIQFLQWILFPFVIFFVWLTNLVAGKETADNISEEEIKILAHTGAKQGNIEQDEHVMMKNLFQFNDISADDIMTPRVQGIFLDEEMTIDQAGEIVEKSPYSRYPVMRETPDTIIGFVHARDIMIAYKKDKEEKSIKKILHPIFSIPAQMKLDELLREFQKRQTHMAIVVDEFGGTEGIVTLEDVLEELVGEITDEHDVEDNIIKRVDKKTVIASGDENIRDINDFLNCVIPGDPLDTIAEVMLDFLEKMPRKNMSVTLGNTVCKIIEVKNRRIERVEVKKT